MKPSLKIEQQAPDTQRIHVFAERREPTHVNFHTH